MNKNGVICKNGDIISNNSIIEFSYDLNKKINWLPLRRRNNLTPNALSTACNIWNTIFNPITIENITLGENILDKDIDYYDVDKDNNSPMKSIYKFHNLIKKNLIQSNCNKGDSLLDLSCGELGDLYKWISCELSFVVGIDINQNNLINEVKGATTRILDLKKKDNNELLDNIFIIWGDSSKNIKNSMAGLDSLNKFYIDLLWGNPINRNHIHRLNNKKIKSNRGRCQDKFNVISSQFSFHYFFKNKNTLDNYLKNVSENLKIGGKLLITCFDGTKIYNLLEDRDFIEKRNQNNNILWRIDKKYDTNTLYNTDKCLGMPIEVYVDTFKNSFEEYLVNIDYLKTILPNYGLQIISTKEFKDYKDELNEIKLFDDGIDFSYLNTSIIIEKNKEIDFLQKGGNKLDLFLANTDLLTTDSDNEEEDLYEFNPKSLNKSFETKTSLFNFNKDNDDENQTDVKKDNDNIETENEDNKTDNDNIETEDEDIETENEDNKSDNDNIETEDEDNKSDNDNIETETENEDIETENEDIETENKIKISKKNKKKVLKLDNLEDDSNNTESDEIIETEIKNENNLDKLNNLDFKIEKLDEIDLGPTFTDEDIDIIFNKDENIKSVEPPKFDNLNNENNNLNNENNNSNNVNLEKPSQNNVKIVKLDVDKNVYNMINK